LIMSPGGMLRSRPSNKCERPTPEQEAASVAKEIRALSVVASFVVIPFVHLVVVHRVGVVHVARRADDRRAAVVDVVVVRAVGYVIVLAGVGVPHARLVADAADELVVHLALGDLVVLPALHARIEGGALFGKALLRRVEGRLVLRHALLVRIERSLLL